MKTWIAVPVLAHLCAVLALLLGGSAVDAACAAAAGAAIVHALRSLAEPGQGANAPAVLVGAGAAALLGTALIVDLPGAHAVPLLAVAAASWTIAELTRTHDVASRNRAVTGPHVALAPAIAATVLEPSFVALVGIAAVRAIPRTRDRGHTHAWAIVLPVAGAGCVLLAIVTATAHGGALGALGARWYGAPSRDVSTTIVLSRIAGALGPLLVIAMLGGLAVLVPPAGRAMLANVAIVACAFGIVLVALRAGGPTPATLGFAALCAGAGIARLAGMIRIRSGQAIAAATCGFLVLFPVVLEHLVR